LYSFRYSMHWCLFSYLLCFLYSVSSSSSVYTLSLHDALPIFFDLGVASTFAALDLEENIMGLPKGENNASLGNTISDVYESDEDYVNLGGLKEPDYEALAALDPEIIMIHGRQSNSNVVGELEKEIGRAHVIHVAADNSNYF